MADTLDLFRDTLTEIASGPHQRPRLVEDLLRRLNEKGLTLEQCADAKIMDRSVRTLKRYAREFDLTFPDYTPRKLKGQANG